MSEDVEARPSARADLVSAGIWVAVGAAIVIGSWRMDRLENMGVQAFAAPGLVPGILGVLILASAMLIVGRSLQRLRTEKRAASGSGVDARRAGLTLAMCLAFAAGLVGHGVPFWAAAFVYLFLHIFLLQWPERRAEGTVARGALVALAVAAGVSAFVTIVFQQVFLVRLP